MKSLEQKEYQRKWKQHKQKTDSRYRAIRNARKRAQKYIQAKGVFWTKSISKSLGCSASKFKKHIESQFTKGMTWDNYGSGDDCWNIDHIKPLKHCTTENEIVKCCHYTNLRPLWQKDNLTRDDYDNYL